jgi:hypothetical protein
VYGVAGPGAEGVGARGCRMASRDESVRGVALLSLRSTSSRRVWVRPQRKKRSAASTITLSAATTMPAVAPGPRACCCVGRTDGDASTGVDVGSGDSAGKGSPGFSMYVLFFAAWRCDASGVLALGFTAPTMP